MIPAILTMGKKNEIRQFWRKKERLKRLEHSGIEIRVIAEVVYRSVYPDRLLKPDLLIFGLVVHIAESRCTPDRSRCGA